MSSINSYEMWRWKARFSLLSVILFCRNPLLWSSSSLVLCFFFHFPHLRKQNWRKFSGQSFVSSLSRKEGKKHWKGGLEVNFSGHWNIKMTWNKPIFLKLLQFFRWWAWNERYQISGRCVVSAIQMLMFSWMLLLILFEGLEILQDERAWEPKRD